MSKESIIKDMKAKFWEEARDLPDIIEFSIGEDEADDETVILPVTMTVDSHGLSNTQKFYLSCYDIESPEDSGIDYQTEDADVGEITSANIMTRVYFGTLEELAK